MVNSTPVSRAESDRPDIIALPPVIFLGGVVLSLLLHFFVLARRIGPEPYPVIIGLLLAVTAFSFFLPAIFAMRAAGTHFHPTQPTLAIVRRGPYRFTRNPMYLGFCLLQLALGFLLNDWITFLVVIPLALLLHFGVILREEHYLEAKFGEQYLELKRSVRRWL